MHQWYVLLRHGSMTTSHIKVYKYLVLHVDEKTEKELRAEFLVMWTNAYLIKFIPYPGKVNSQKVARKVITHITCMYIHYT